MKKKNREAVRPGRGLRRLTLEALEDRRLLAVLNVGAGEKYATIQAAVDAARPGDEVLLADGQYAESVDLSRMGVARGGSTGDLIIRGESADLTIVTPSGTAASRRYGLKTRPASGATAASPSWSRFGLGASITPRPGFARKVSSRPAARGCSP